MALITGASRGIGRGIAKELAGEGLDLVIHYAANRAAAEEAVKEVKRTGLLAGKGIRALAVQADLGEAGQRRELIECCRREYGRLDLLVNNAGITSMGRSDLLEASEENFDRLIAVNLKGPYFLTQLAAKWMIQEVGQDAGREPKIVIVSSISGYAVSTNRGDYCLAKAALGMMTKLYAVRLAEYGIRVYEICPGVIETDMTAPVKEKYDRLIAGGLTPIKRWGSPRDVGRAVVALASGALPFSTGEVINVDGGFHLRRL